MLFDGLYVVVYCLVVDFYVFWLVGGIGCIDYIGDL